MNNLLKFYKMGILDSQFFIVISKIGALKWKIGANQTQSPSKEDDHLEQKTT